VEVEVGGITVAYYAGMRYVELISSDGGWRAEVRIDYRTGQQKYYYMITVHIVSQDGRAYLSLETNRKEASALLRIMRRVPKTEAEAVKKASELLLVTKGLIGSILGPALRL
jgi:hypothetical protein